MLFPRRRGNFLFFVFFLFCVSSLFSKSSSKKKKPKPLLHPHDLAEIKKIFTRKKEYNLFIIPFYNFATQRPEPLTLRCHESNDGHQHSLERFIGKLLLSIQQKGLAIPIRNKTSSVILSSDYRKSNLFFSPHNAKTMHSLDLKDWEKYHQYLRRYVDISICGGCQLIIPFAAGDFHGLDETLKSFPNFISVVVGHSAVGFSVTVPYPHTTRACGATSSFSSTIRNVRRDLLLFYRGFNDSAHDTQTKNHFRTSLAKSVNKQAVSLYVKHRVLVEHLFLNGSQPQNDYVNKIASSTFCLCPKGTTPGSQRMMEVALYGCIPVIISNDYHPPFEKYLEPFFVKFKEDEVDVLVKKLLELEQDGNGVRKLQKNLVDYIDKWAWDMKKFHKNIVLQLMLHEAIAFSDLSRKAFDTVNNRKTVFAYSQNELNNELCKQSRIEKCNPYPHYTFSKDVFDDIEEKRDKIITFTQKQNHH